MDFPLSYVDAPSGQCCQCWVHFKKIYFRNTFLRLLVQHKLGLKRGGICDPSLGIRCKFRESAPQSENLCLSVLWPAGDPVQLASGRKCKRGDVCTRVARQLERHLVGQVGIFLLVFVFTLALVLVLIQLVQLDMNWPIRISATCTGQEVHQRRRLHQQGSWR